MIRSALRRVGTYGNPSLIVHITEFAFIHFGDRNESARLLVDLHAHDAVMSHPKKKIRTAHQARRYRVTYLHAVPPECVSSCADGGWLICDNSIAAMSFVPMRTEKANVTVVAVVAVVLVSPYVCCQLMTQDEAKLVREKYVCCCNIVIPRQQCSKQSDGHKDKEEDELFHHHHHLASA